MVLDVIIVDIVMAIVAPAPCGSPGVCKLLRGLTVMWFNGDVMYSLCDCEYGVNGCELSDMECVEEWNSSESPWNWNNSLSDK